MLLLLDLKSFELPVHIFKAILKAFISGMLNRRGVKKVMTNFNKTKPDTSLNTNGTIIH